MSSTLPLPRIPLTLEIEPSELKCSFFKNKLAKLWSWSCAYNIITKSLYALLVLSSHTTLLRMLKSPYEWQLPSHFRLYQAASLTSHFVWFCTLPLMIALNEHSFKSISLLPCFINFMMWWRLDIWDIIHQTRHITNLQFHPTQSIKQYASMANKE